MKQHYLPQFYLRGFCDPVTPDRQEPYVWLCDLLKDKWKKKAPKNIAAINNYYAPDFLGHKERNSMEQLFSEIESHAASIIKTKLINRRCVTYDEKRIIAMFVALLRTRVPYFRNQFEHSVSMVDDVISLFIEDKIREHLGLSDKANASNRMFKPNRDERLIAAIPLIALNEVTSVLVEMKWRFFYCNGSYITSDFPFIIENPYEEKNIYSHGLLNNAIEISVPISSDITLTASWDNDKETEYVDAKERVVAELNRRIICCASTFIISSSRAFPGIEWIDERKK